VSQAEATRILRKDDLWEAKYHAITPYKDKVRCLSINITRLAGKLRFQGGKDRLPKKFKGQHLQRMRTLTDESAAILDEAWEFAIRDEKTGKNPPWDRDELILGLDLYFQFDKKRFVPNERGIVELSELLRKRMVFLGSAINEKSRNTNGVSKKLWNLSSGSFGRSIRATYRPAPTS